MTVEATTLAVSHADLVRRIAQGERGRLGGDVDELIGDGMVGLVRAAMRFDPARWDGPFRHFARPQIVQAMVDGYRHRTHFNRTLGRGKYEMVAFMSEGTDDVFPPTRSAEQLAVGAIEADRLLALIAELPAPLRRVADAVIDQDGAVQGGAVKRLALEEGVTESRVSQRLADVRRRVRTTSA